MSAQWWETLFDDKYMVTYVDRVTEADTRSQLSFFTEMIPPKARILDLACGYGRLAIPLVKEGYMVTGFDFSSYLLGIARQEARSANTNISFVRGDMRQLPFASGFDAIINVFTSFGYFDTIEEDLAVLRGVHRGLRNDGCFVLDFTNSPMAIHWLYEKGEIDPITGELVTEEVETLSNGLIVKRIERLDVGSLRWHMERSWQEGGLERSYCTNVRLYFLTELVQLLRNVGLQVERVYGDFDASPYQPDSRRILIVSRKC